jgi:hypothetical protein
MAMLTREVVDDLIRLHAMAYRLLMWLDREAGENPNALARDVVEVLQKPASCGPWLMANRSKLPKDALPEGPIREEFVNLFSSYFSTSFQVEHVSFGGELLESHLSTRSTKRSHKSKGHTGAQALALKHLASSQGIRLSDAEARNLAQRKLIQPHLLLWTYIWELDRRANAKGKGEVVHRIWRSLPLTVRKNLCTDAVWAAREEIVGILRATVADGN